VRLLATLIAAKRMYRDLEDEMAYMTGLTYDIRKNVEQLAQESASTRNVCWRGASTSRSKILV
jgi:hypothetical protein